MRQGTINALEYVFTGNYVSPQNSWQAAGHYIGLPMSGAASIISNEAFYVAGVELFISGKQLITSSLNLGTQLVDRSYNLAKNAELKTADYLFKLTISPDPAGAMARQAAMLRKNVGYNISAISDFNMYSQIGREVTFLSDYRTSAEVLGLVRANQEFSVGLFSSKYQVSFFKARTLALNLELENPDQLIAGFRFSRISGINNMYPRSPLIYGNEFFMPGQGLPNSGPEIVVNPIPTKPWPWR